MTPLCAFAPGAAAALLPALLALLAGPAQAQTQAQTTTAHSQDGAPANKVGATVTSSTGLVLQVLKPGQGPKPRASDVVRVHYRGTLADGTEFDSSYKRGEPAQFPLDRVIPCWTEGLQQTAVGSTVRLTCPPAIAYGARGAGGVIPPNATLRFDVELLAIVNSR